MGEVYTLVCIQVYSPAMDDEDQLFRASEVVKEAERKEFRLIYLAESGEGLKGRA